jgi:hypothetical protein
LAADEADLLLQAEENLAAESLANMAAHGPPQGGSSSLGAGLGAAAAAAGSLAEAAGDEAAASGGGYGFGAFDSLVTGAFLGFLFQVDGLHDHDHPDDDNPDDGDGSGDRDEHSQDAPYFEPYDLAEGPWPGTSRL